MLENSINQIYTPIGFFTPSVFSILLHHEVARTERYPSSITLTILSVCFPAPLTDEIRDGADLLFFKILKTKLRQTDIFSKYEENYLVLLTCTDQTGAQIAIRRILDHLNTSMVTKQNRVVDLGVCAGLASHPSGPTTTVEILLERASKAHQTARTVGPGALETANS